MASNRQWCLNGGGIERKVVVGRYIVLSEQYHKDILDGDDPISHGCTITLSAEYRHAGTKCQSNGLHGRHIEACPATRISLDWKCGFRIDSGKSATQFV
jgi:hypothetical protein